jgi:hypothetical protein
MSRLNFSSVVSDTLLLEGATDPGYHVFVFVFNNPFLLYIAICACNGSAVFAQGEIVIFSDPFGVFNDFVNASTVF